MAITDKEEGVWSLDEVYNKQNEGDILDLRVATCYKFIFDGDPTVLEL
jgi:hypothetical protein